MTFAFDDTLFTLRVACISNLLKVFLEPSFVLLLATRAMINGAKNSLLSRTSYYCALLKIMNFVANVSIS